MVGEEEEEEEDDEDDLDKNQLTALLDQMQQNQLFR